MPDSRAAGLTLPAFALVVLFGGTNFVAGRLTLRELSPFWAAAIRLAAASALLFLLVWLQRLPLPRGRGLIGALVYGLLGFGAGYAFAYWGFQRVPAGLGAEPHVLPARVSTWVALAYLIFLGSSAVSTPLVVGGVVVLLGVFVGTVTQVPFVKTPHRIGSEPCLTCAE